MKKIITSILFFCTVIDCSAQIRESKSKERTEPELVINDTIAEIDTIRSTIRLYNHNLSSHWGDVGTKLNDREQIISKQSQEPLDCALELSLHSTETRENFYPPIVGYLSGNIVKGKREAQWTKEVLWDNKRIIVKKMNYKEGLLDGAYVVFNLKGDTLNWISQFKRIDGIETVLDDNNRPIVEKKVTSFQNGTGDYTDYYYDSGKLKIKGFMWKGKRDGLWKYYDKKGEMMFYERYSNGFLISE